MPGPDPQPDNESSQQDVSSSLDTQIENDTDLLFRMIEVIKAISSSTDRNREAVARNREAVTRNREAVTRNREAVTRNREAVARNRDLILRHVNSTELDVDVISNTLRLQRDQAVIEVAEAVAAARFEVMVVAVVAGVVAVVTGVLGCQVWVIKKKLGSMP